nr:copia protein [Tanacetum cinerariifolium]
MTSRPDIMFSVCLCAHFQEAPKTPYLEAVKHIFRYIKGTTHLGLWYLKGISIETVVYADSDHAGDYVDQKSTSGICTFVRCCLASWFSKKQTALSISATEAEYVSTGKACQQTLWRKQAFIDYNIRLDDVPIMCDNKGAINLSENPMFKHAVSVFPELEIDHYISHDQVMHPFAPHYKRKTLSDHGKKRPHELNASSSSTTLNHPSSSCPLDDTIDENDDESSYSNSSSSSQNVTSSSNVILGTRSDHGKKRPHELNASSSSTTLNHPSSSCPLDDTIDENDDESSYSNSSYLSQNVSSLSNVVLGVRQNHPHESYKLNTYFSETINLQTQQRDAHRDRLRSIGQALKNMMEIDHYISHDQVMHPFAPYYERKTRSDHGKKRPHELNASSSSTTLNHPSSSCPLDDTIDEND